MKNEAIDMKMHTYSFGALIVKHGKILLSGLALAGIVVVSLVVGSVPVDNPSTPSSYWLGGTNTVDTAYQNHQGSLYPVDWPDSPDHSEVTTYIEHREHRP